jgi:hypothetical protein
MRTRNAAASRTDHQGQLTPLMALLLMVVVPSLLVAMTRVTDPASRLLLGLAVSLALVAGGTYAYHLGKPV